MSDREVVVRTVKLRKEFKGSVAVDDLDLQLEKGDISGLIGPNGAGKTTIIKMLATLLRPTSGSAYIYGYDIFRDTEKVRGIIGYVPDFFNVYGDLKVWEYLDFFAAAYRIPKRRRSGIIDDVLELTDLVGKKNSYTRDFSRGMKQRLCLAKTLINDPVVLLLDDPASGLDPRARFEIREILKELQNMGKTVLISSNVLSELADFCNKIAIIEKGKLIFSGDISSFSQMDVGSVLEIKIHNGIERAREILESRQDVKNIDVEGSVIKAQYTGDREGVHNVLASLVSGQVEVYSFRETMPDLEDAFLKVTKGVIS